MLEGCNSTHSTSNKNQAHLVAEGPTVPVTLQVAAVVFLWLSLGNVRCFLVLCLLGDLAVTHCHSWFLLNLSEEGWEGGQGHPASAAFRQS